MNTMKTLFLTLVMTAAPVLHAAETLPDSSAGSVSEDQDMHSRFHSTPMDTEEMQNLYLQSPTELSNAEEEGLRSVTDQDRYTETDLLQRERLQGGRTDSLGPPPSFERPQPPALPSIPMRQL